MTQIQFARNAILALEMVRVAQRKCVTPSGPHNKVSHR